jgi:hypothetical protein
VGTTTEDCTLIAPATMVLFCWWLQIMSSTRRTRQSMMR